MTEKMQKSNVLIVVPSFDSGGTVTSLINFVTLVDKKRYQINVFAITNSGVNKKYIADHCTIIGDTKTTVFGSTFKDVLRAKIMATVKCIKKGVKKIGVDISPILFRYYAHKLDKANYDFVIAFQEAQATLFCSYFRHGFKIAWVRSEYSRFIKSVGDRYSKVYEKYDRIVSVSKASMDSFLGILPQYQNIAIVQYNFLNDSRIITLSNEEIDDFGDSSIFTIVSVGRIDPVKRFSEIPRITRSLLEKGLQFRWIIIGGVAVKSEYLLLKQKLVEYKTPNVILLGNKSNPYPYIKKSNLLVSLSISETFNNTLTEAKILGIPVVTTDYPCAFESIKNEEEGIISDFNSLPKNIERMLNDEEGIYQHVRRHLSNYKYNKEELLQNLYDRILV